MYKHLDSVNWKNINQATGDSSHIPAALMGLISKDVTKRNNAYNKLDNHVVVQSDLYEAAFYVLPFLMEIIKSDDVSKKHSYELLFEIANGIGPDNVYCQYNNEKLLLQNACRQYVIDHFRHFLYDLENTSSKYRKASLSLLGSLHELKNETVPILQKICNNETDQKMLKSLNDAIIDLRKSDEEREMELSSLLEMFPPGLKKS